MNRHSLGNLQSVHLAQVTDNVDPNGRGQIKALLMATEMEVWASVVVPSAGKGYGFSFIPKVDEIVVLAFVTPDLPMVLGSIWSGENSMPEQADTAEDHYIVRTPAGTVMEFDDGNGPQLSLTTPAGNSVTMTDSNGGEVEMKCGGETITLSTAGINIDGSTLTINADAINMNAPQITANCSMSKFSGVVQSDTDISNSVVGASYTCGAGNIW